MRPRIPAPWLPVATRTATSFAVLVVVVVVGIGLAGQPWRAWDLGTATQNLARVHAIVIPLTIAWSAYAGLDLAHRAGWRRAERSPRPEAAALGQLARSVLPPVLGYLGAVILISLVGAVLRAPGNPHPFWLLSAVLAVIAAACGGAALGSVLARWRSGLRWLIPGGLAVAVYAGFLPLVLLTNSRTQWLRSLYPIVYDTAGPYDVLSLSTLLGRILWFGGVAGVLVAVLLMGQSARAGAVRPGLLAVAILGIGCAVLGAMTLRSTSGLLIAGVVTPERRCHDGDGVTVCLYPNRDDDAAGLIAAFGELHERTASSTLVMRRFVQVDQEPNGVAADEVPFQLNGFDPDSVTEAVESAVHAHVERVQCGTAQAEAFRGIVLTWLSGRELTPMLDSERAFAALSETDKRLWLGDHVAEVESCTLTAASFVRAG